MTSSPSLLDDQSLLESLKVRTEIHDSIGLKFGIQVVKVDSPGSMGQCWLLTCWWCSYSCSVYISQASFLFPGIVALQVWQDVAHAQSP